MNSYLIIFFIGSKIPFNMCLLQRHDVNLCHMSSPHCMHHTTTTTRHHTATTPPLCCHHTPPLATIRPAHPTTKPQAGHLQKY